MDHGEYGTYVQKVRNDTNRWLAQLKGDNENLRRQVVGLQSERNRLQQEKLRLLEQLVNVREELSSHLEEHTSLIRRLGDTEQQNERVAGQFIALEAQNANLANLYVASYQLRASLDRDMILSVMKEIIINLIGSEDFGIFEKNGDRLDMVGWFHDKPREYETIAVGSGVIGSVAQTGRTYFAAPEASGSGVTACIPLKVEDRVTGVIAVFSLLPQKDEVIESLDRELLDLLASQAGIALHCATLHQNMGRGAA